MKKRYLLLEKNNGTYNNVVEWDKDNDNWTCPESLLPVLENDPRIFYYALVSQDNTVTKTMLAYADIFDKVKDTLPDKWSKIDKKQNIVCAGFMYNEKTNTFTPPKPFPSWILDENTQQWNAPIPYPSDNGILYTWNEELKNWKAS